MTREILGTDLLLFVENEDGDDVLVGCAQEFSINVTRAELNTSCKSTGAWASAKGGQKSWTFSLTGIYKIYDTSEAADNFSVDDWFNRIDSGEVVKLRGGTDVTGDKSYKGDAIVLQWGFTSPADGATATYNASGKGTSPLLQVANPAPTP
jgi:predicted secreted protein